MTRVFAILILTLIPTLVCAWPDFDPPPPPPESLQVTEYLRIESPLYVAYVDKATKLCRRIDYTVTADHLGEVGDKRAFRPMIRYRDSLLEYDDYTHSGYDRGHLRALSLSAGSEYYDDVNSMAVIVPMAPKVNREHFRAVELYIERWARIRSTDVSIVCLYDQDITMANADEPHRVPSGFIVTVIANGLRTRFDISNEKEREE